MGNHHHHLLLEIPNSDKFTILNRLIKIWVYTKEAWGKRDTGALEQACGSALYLEQVEESTGCGEVGPYIKPCWCIISFLPEDWGASSLLY